jgi:hypothetical protein
VTPRLAAVTPRQAIRALERWGWQLDRVRAGTTCSATSGIGRDEFLRLI